MASMNSEENFVSELLKLSREEIKNGNGSEALSAVIQAIIATSGEESVLGILDQVNSQVKLNKERQLRDIAYNCCKNLVNQETILSESGDEHILIDAFQDGSSVICQNCGALVSVERAEAHAKYWCDAIETTDDDC